MHELLIFVGLVLGANLLPAFGPPTWSLIVLTMLNTDAPAPLLIVLGAIAAASGRLLLALATRALGDRFLSKRSRANLAAARQALEAKKRNGILALGLFALSPLPSAQLFEAAGLARVRLLPFTFAFFAGRLVSYSLYALAADGLRATSLGETFKRELTSPLGIALQLGMLLGIVLLMRVDWAKRLKRSEPSRD
ncbi:hypothetical protein [Sphingomonas astaxanthinifaciens]|uniref:Membrane protein DedA, SNARE-associated domain n=1 Tax=Sphingomonas astaxanthinifaciens DSM 22298 TaxID=1123267 RepID=A0ABQ5Z4G0_9SPHN|nr:hypothetical protein [Sphingomonas astaxanthinifaciens]GLR46834.1 hypothetical protein GCM10007925_05450 [Sphingomonas astaxanthinifaciens DSM 22298]